MSYLDRPRDLPPVPPGAHLQDILDELQMTPYRLSRLLHVPQTAVGEILKGKRRITLEMAFRLGRLFGQSPQFWLNAQTDYDAEMAEASGLNERIAAEIEPLPV